jgi:glutathione peroxidase
LGTKLKIHEPLEGGPVRATPSLILSVCVFFFALQSFATGTSTVPDLFYELSASDISGKKVNFSTYRGKVVLVVNTASECGFAPQLKDLEDLYKKYASQGFVVLAFPSNDFKQEKGDNADIQAFAKKEYQTTFPFFEKAPVRGADKQPVYQFLSEKKPGILFKDVGWNFEKFLINRKGEVVERWSSITKPSSGSITKAVEQALTDPL